MWQLQQLEWIILADSLFLHDRIISSRPLTPRVNCSKLANCSRLRNLTFFTLLTPLSWRLSHAIIQGCLFKSFAPTGDLFVTHFLDRKHLLAPLSVNESFSQSVADWYFQIGYSYRISELCKLFSSWFIRARLGRLVTVYRTNVDSRLATLFFDFQWNFSSCGKAADWSQCILRLECEQWCPLAGGVCNLAWRMVFSPIWGLINCFGVRSPAFAAMLGPSMHPAQYT